MSNRLTSLFNFKRMSGVAATLLLSGCLAFAGDPYTIGFYVGANEGLADAQMHITNPGSTGGYGNPVETPTATPSGGDLCANVYVFAPDEELIDCCSCKISPNGMQGFSLATDLVGNPLTVAVPHAGAIKVVSSPGGGPPAGLGAPPSSIASATTVSGLACDAGSAYAPGGVLQTWLTHVRTLGTAFGAPETVTEIPFEDAGLSPSELYKLQTQCYAIEASPSRGGVGSAAGICRCDPNKAL